MTLLKVLVTKQPDEHYTARALLFPDVISSGMSEQEAIEQLREVLADIQSRSHVIHVDLPIAMSDTDNSWLPFVGMWRDDANWDAFQEEIAAYRAEIDTKFETE